MDKTAWQIFTGTDDDIKLTDSYMLKNMKSSINLIILRQY
jgi:hypothetical protein